MEGSSHELLFRALKELAIRLDREIADASNHLAGPKTHSPASGVQIFERAETTAGQLQLVKTRIDIVVKQQMADLEDLKQYERHMDWDSEETLKKMIPRGFRVPESLLPTVEHLSLPEEKAEPEKGSTTAVTAESLFSSYPSVMDLEVVFGPKAVGPSQLQGRVDSRMPNQPRRTQRSTQVSRIPIPVQPLPLFREPTALQEPSMTSKTDASLFSSFPSVEDFDDVFSRKATGPSQLPKQGQVALSVPKQQQRLQGSTQVSRIPIGPIHSRTRLEKYLARIDCDDTVELTQCNPPLPAEKTAVKFPPASSTPMTGAMAPLPLEEPSKVKALFPSKLNLVESFGSEIQEPSTVMRFSTPIYGIPEESMSGIQPLSDTSELKENILEKVPDKEPRKPGAMTPELKTLPDPPVSLKKHRQTLEFSASKHGFLEDNFTSGIQVSDNEPRKPGSTTPELKELPATPVSLKRRNLEDLLNSQ